MFLIKEEALSVTHKWEEDSYQDEQKRLHLPESLVLIDKAIHLDGEVRFPIIVTEDSEVTTEFIETVRPATQEEIEALFQDTIENRYLLEVMADVSKEILEGMK